MKKIIQGKEAPEIMAALEAEEMAPLFRNVHATAKVFKILCRASCFGQTSGDLHKACLNLC